MTVNYIKQKMNDGHAVLGPFLKMNDPALIEQAALAGFDFCIIDMEPVSYTHLQSLHSRMHMWQQQRMHMLKLVEPIWEK